MKFQIISLCQCECFAHSTVLWGSGLKLHARNSACCYINFTHRPTRRILWFSSRENDFKTINYGLTRLWVFVLIICWVIRECILKKNKHLQCLLFRRRTLSSTEAAVHVSAPAKSLVAVRKIPRLRLQQSLRCFTFISVVSNTCIVFQSHSRERAWTENIASCWPSDITCINF